MLPVLLVLSSQIYFFIHSSIPFIFKTIKCVVIAMLRICKRLLVMERVMFEMAESSGKVETYLGAASTLPYNLALPLSYCTRILYAYEF